MNHIFLVSLFLTLLTTSLCFIQIAPSSNVVFSDNVVVAKTVYGLDNDTVYDLFVQYNNKVVGLLDILRGVKSDWASDAVSRIIEQEKSYIMSNPNFMSFMYETCVTYNYAWPWQKANYITDCSYFDKIIPSPKGHAGLNGKQNLKSIGDCAWLGVLGIFTVPFMPSCISANTPDYSKLAAVTKQLADQNHEDILTLFSYVKKEDSRIERLSSDMLDITNGLKLALNSTNNAVNSLDKQINENVVPAINTLITTTDALTQKVNFLKLLMDVERVLRSYKDSLSLTLIRALAQIVSFNHRMLTRQFASLDLDLIDESFSSVIPAGKYVYGVVIGSKQISTYGFEVELAIIGTDNPAMSTFLVPPITFLHADVAYVARGPAIVACSDSISCSDNLLFGCRAIDDLFVCSSDSLKTATPFLSYLEIVKSSVIPYFDVYDASTIEIRRSFDLVVGVGSSLKTVKVDVGTIVHCSGILKSLEKKSESLYYLLRDDVIFAYVGIDGVTYSTAAESYASYTLAIKRGFVVHGVDVDGKIGKVDIKLDAIAATTTAASAAFEYQLYKQGTKLDTNMVIVNTTFDNMFESFKVIDNTVQGLDYIVGNFSEDYFNYTMDIVENNLPELLNSSSVSDLIKESMYALGNVTMEDLQNLKEESSVIQSELSRFEELSNTNWKMLSDKFSAEMDKVNTDLGTSMIWTYVLVGVVVVVLLVVLGECLRSKNQKHLKDY